MTGDNSTSEEEQPVGAGCIMKFFLCGLGIFLGGVAGEWFSEFQRSLEGGPDEGGSMGIILPSTEAFFGAVFGGLIGIFVYPSIHQAVRNIPVAKREELIRVLFFVFNGLFVGVWVGLAFKNVAVGAALGGIGLLVSLLVLMRTRRE